MCTLENCLISTYLLCFSFRVHVYKMLRYTSATLTLKLVVRCVYSIDPLNRFILIFVKKSHLSNLITKVRNCQLEIVCLFVVFRPTRELYTHLETYARHS